MVSQQREPHLILNSEWRRVGGLGGCNRLMGSYDLSGDHLTFGQMATTMMACPEGMDTEKAFLDVLTQVKTWKISRQQLELFNAGGHLVARLEARHMKKPGGQATALLAKVSEPGPASAGWRKDVRRRN